MKKSHLLDTVSSAVSYCFSCSLHSLLLAGMLLGPMSGANAAVIHHWQFENSPGFLQDAVGAATLSVAGGVVTQATLPSSGRGANFNGFPGNTLAADSNNGLLHTTTAALTDNFTVEILVHFDELDDAFAEFLVGQADSRASGSWGIQVRRDTFGGTVRDEFALITHDGGGFAAIGSGIVLQTGNDYYLAANFQSSGAATFYVQNLSDGTPLQIVNQTHSVGALLAFTDLSIGGIINEGLFRTKGLIDEVRLSDTVLGVDDLLIANYTAVVPVPAAIWLFGSGLIGLIGLARREKYNDQMLDRRGPSGSSYFKL